MTDAQVNAAGLGAAASIRSGAAQRALRITSRPAS